MRISYIIIVIICFVVSNGQANSETITATYTYTLGDNDSRNDAKKIAFFEAKQLCIEKAGTLVKARFERHIKESIQNEESVLNELTNQDITTYVGAIIKTQIIEEKFEFSNGVQQITITVSAEVDNQEILQEIEHIAGNEDLKKAVHRQQDELNDLKEQIDELQEELNKSNDSQAREIRIKRKELFNEVDEIEAVKLNIKNITQKAVTNIDIGMTEEDVRKVAGMPRIVDECLSDVYWNYGNVWVVFSSGTVIAIVRAHEWSGRCHRVDHYRQKSIK